MAKETKTAATQNTEAANVSVETIYENLDKAVVATDESLPAKVREQIKKESDERIVGEMKERFQKAQYSIESSLLGMRRDKEKAEVSRMRLTVIDRLARLMMGFVVTKDVIARAKHHDDSLFNIEKVDAKDETISITKDGKTTTYKVGESVPAVIDYVDYDSMLEKAKKEDAKLCKEADDKYDTYNKKLQAKFGNYWNRSWYWF
jgi:hypothetical protein